MTSERRPTQRELLEGAICTIEDVLVPELRSPWAKSSAIGLLGQLRYAMTREVRDSLVAQDAELDACIESLCGEFTELRVVVRAVESSGDVSWDLREQAGKLLIFALAGETDAVRAVRERLRPLLVAHMDADLAESGPMLQAFLASGSLGSTGS